MLNVDQDLLRGEDGWGGGGLRLVEMMMISMMVFEEGIKEAEATSNEGHLEDSSSLELIGC